MQLIFNWCENFYQKENEAWREGEEEMIALEISQREWGFATAKVTLARVQNEKLMVKKNRETKKSALICSSNDFGNGHFNLDLTKRDTSCNNFKDGDFHELLHENPKKNHLVIGKIEEENSLNYMELDTDKTYFEEFFPKKYAKIGQKLKNGDIETIFIGRVLNFPIKISGTTIDLEFIAEPPDYQAQLKILAQEYGLKSSKTVRSQDGDASELFPIQSLFYASQENNNPTLLLEGKNEIFYWNMKNGKLEISHIFHGKNNFEISGDEILEKSLKIHLSREPYAAVNLKLSADWIKSKNNVVDLFPIISEKFNYGMVNSYSNLMQPLMEFGKNANTKNYEIIYRDIKEINPNTMGCLTNYPTSSQDFVISEGKKINFKRFYYDGNIILNWHQKYKISETVSVKLINGEQREGREKNIRLKLQNIQSSKEYPDWCPYSYYRGGMRVIFQGHIWKCRESHQAKNNFVSAFWKRLHKINTSLVDDTTASFFATEIGKRAIKYGMQKALALMNYSSRYVEVGFCINVNSDIQLSVADSVHLKNLKNFPIELQGKVVKTKFFADHKSRFLKVTIACGQNLSKNFRYLEAFSPEIKVQDSETDIREIINNIEIKNLPEHQEEELRRSNLKTTSEYKKILKNTTTSVAISLQNYREKREITRDINLGIYKIKA